MLGAEPMCNANPCPDFIRSGMSFSIAQLQVEVTRSNVLSIGGERNVPGACRRRTDRGYVGAFHGSANSGCRGSQSVAAPAMLPVDHHSAENIDLAEVRTSRGPV